MAKITDDGTGKGDRADQGKETAWNVEGPKGWYAGQNEYYDPANDRYVLKQPRKIKIELEAVKPEMTSEFIEKIKKKCAEIEGFRPAPRGVPVAVRFRLLLPDPAPKKNSYRVPPVFNLSAWADFIYTGLQGVLYDSCEQIVCCGHEVYYNFSPGIIVESYVLPSAAYTPKARPE